MTAPLGRPRLTERRKAATRLEIAREAVGLFATQGVAATSADQIATAAGISLRTFWRYFPTKESCVLPLLTTGVGLIADALRAWPAYDDVGGLIDIVERRSDRALADASEVLALLRLTRTEPALRAIWLQAHDEAEPEFAAALADRSGQPADSIEIRIQAAMINAALRAATEHYAWHEGAPGEIDHVVRTALLTAARGAVVLTTGQR